MGCSQNYYVYYYISFALHFICTTFKKSATSARNACHVMIQMPWITFAFHEIKEQ